MESFIKILKVFVYVFVLGMCCYMVQSDRIEPIIKNTDTINKSTISVLKGDTVVVKENPRSISDDPNISLELNIKPSIDNKHFTYEYWIWYHHEIIRGTNYNPYYPVEYVERFTDSMYKSARECLAEWKKLNHK